MQQSHSTRASNQVVAVLHVLRALEQVHGVITTLLLEPVGLHLLGAHVHVIQAVERTLALVALHGLTLELVGTPERLRQLGAVKLNVVARLRAPDVGPTADALSQPVALCYD